MLKLAVCCVALFALALFVWNAVTTFHEEYFDVDANIPAALLDDIDLPEQRSFHMGFYDEAGVPRPALRIWDSWNGLPFSRRAEN